MLTEITLVNRARALVSGYGKVRLDLCHIVCVCQGWRRAKRLAMFWKFSFLSEIHETSKWTLILLLLKYFFTRNYTILIITE